MTITGSSILIDGPPGAHLVYPYTDEGSLVTVVTQYALAGLLKGDSVVLILSDDRCAKVTNNLRAKLDDLDTRTTKGQFQCRQAQSSLDSFYVHGRVNREKFLKLVTPLIETAKAAPGRAGLRLYGEMVAILHPANPKAAVALEGHWNDVLRAENACLLCSYSLGAQGQMVDPEITKAHSHYVV